MTPVPFIYPASLSKHFEKVEFGLIRKTVDGQDVYMVISGRAGDTGQIPFGFGNDWEFVYHTHPNGTAMASPDDMELLRQLDQDSSQIVLPDGSVFKYTQTIKNTLNPE